MSTEFTDLPDDVLKMIMDEALLKNIQSITSLTARQNADDRRLGTATPATIEYLERNNPQFLEEITRRQKVYDIYEKAKVKRIATNLFITEFNNRLFRER